MPLNRGEYDDVLLPFVDGMRYKMSNSKRWHGTRSWETATPLQLLEHLRGEVGELEEALRDGSPLEGFLEAVDVANLAAMIADRLGMLRRSPITLTEATPDRNAVGATCPHGYADSRYCPECIRPIHRSDCAAIVGLDRPCDCGADPGFRGASSAVPA